MRFTGPAPCPASPILWRSMFGTLGTLWLCWTPSRRSRWPMERNRRVTRPRRFHLGATASNIIPINVCNQSANPFSCSGRDIVCRLHPIPSREYLPSKIFSPMFPRNACPITTTNRGFPLHLPIGDGLTTNGFIMCEHVKSLDYTARDVQFKERLDQDTLQRVLSIISLFF